METYNNTYGFATLSKALTVSQRNKLATEQVRYTFVSQTLFVLNS